MSKSEEKPDESLKLPETTWLQFITTVPAAVPYHVTDLFTRRDNRHLECNNSDVKLFCHVCKGERFFENIERASVYGDEPTNDFVTFQCKNCEKDDKRIALMLMHKGGNFGGWVVKIGEWPPLSINTPSKVMAFIGPDRDLFLKGLKAEAQGLGIGAFGYYRRVVDNQWKRILDFLIKAAKNIHADSKAIGVLEAAAKEDQFKKAVEMVKDAIPPSLLLGGQHNPLTLLYGVTSDAIHNLSDADCLEAAKHVRVLMTELADRMTKALSDQSEIDDAVRRLFSMKSGSGTKAAADSPAPKE